MAGRFREDGRPLPPEHESDRFKAMWTEIVESEPADMLTTKVSQNLLTLHIRHFLAAEALSDQMENAKDVKEFGTLSRLRNGESRAAGDAATKLRLTNHAKQRATASGTATANQSKPGKKPWEFE